MRRAAKTDSNQQEVVAAIRAAGWSVHVASGVGDGFPDLVCAKGDQVRLIEVKDGSLPPSERTLTPQQKKWHRDWQGKAYVANSVAEALLIIGVPQSASG